MTVVKSISLLILTVLFLAEIESKNVVVKTSKGEVEGVEIQSILSNEHYYSFMGILYGEAPVGPLRFMPPKPHKGWEGVLNAKNEKKACAQYSIQDRKKVSISGASGDEDCLHLSVHTPNADPEANLPLIVFTRNEHYRISFNGTKDYGPDFFMKEGVIIVMINHRLGALGFLSFEDDLLPGNNGLKDVILALKWVRENIRNFGGDPNRVTLMGHEDGAGLTDILLYSPKAKGLFNAAILQSGTSWISTYFTGKARHRAIEFSKVLEQDATTSPFLLKRFEHINFAKIAENEHYAVHADESREIQRGIYAFAPVIEHDHPDAIITKLPEEGPIDIDIPIMIGYTSREALEALNRYLHQPQFLTFADRDFLFLFPVRSGYYFKSTDEVYYDAMKEIKNRYFEEGYVKISRPGEYITYINDLLTFYPIDYTVRKYTNESKSDVFYYMFDFSGELNMRKKSALEDVQTIEGTWGATIGDDLCYLFVCNRIRKEYRKLLKDEDAEEIKVMRNMVRMWANFARTGNPTPAGEPFIWKPATKENKECLVINEDLQMEKNLNEDAVRFWDDFLAKYKAMAKDGVVKDIKDEL